MGFHFIFWQRLIDIFTLLFAYSLFILHENKMPPAKFFYFVHNIQKNLGFIRQTLLPLSIIISCVL